ncbi:HK97-gp10 family putative phage morphogenesis protein [Metabacillus halosaccharovorans]|uniref:HK97-gp10 family putative phage morphogenesis protein n=1 Tax=Metabacillus halosaccharovorans TaxID=930124 RepID=UPI0034CF9A12
MGAYLEVDGMSQIQKRIIELGKKGNKIENKALREGAEIVRAKVSEQAPRSDKPRKQKEGTQSWRTGEHAADHITASRVKMVNGSKVIEVGISRGDNSHYFYLKFHEYGTVKMPPRPFMRRSLRMSRDNARAIMRYIYKKELGL